MVVGQVVTMRLVALPVHAMVDADRPAMEIDRLDVAREELAPADQLAERVHDRRDLEIAGGGLVQHRREKRKVLSIHERDLYLLITCELSLQLQRRGNAPKAAPSDHDLLGWE